MQTKSQTANEKRHPPKQQHKTAQKPNKHKTQQKHKTKTTKQDQKNPL